MAQSDKQSTNLSLARNTKIGLFHLGSGMADVMTTGVWNRIMISDLGFSATPIGLLVSLRYFLAPIGVWAGRMSDRHTVGGYRRLFWIWLGRAMMVLSVFALGAVTASLARGTEATIGIWLLLTAVLLLFSLGNALSGSTFLALIYDRAPEHQRGRAVGIVWTFLLLGFTIGGILFAALLPAADGAETGGLSFTPDTLLNLFVVAGLVLSGLWFFSLLGEERRVRPGEGSADADDPPQAEPTSVWADLRLVWVNQRLRFFLFYLSLSMMFAFSQDLILEPFAGDVFGMDAATTTRFTAYWGSMAILGTLVFLWLSRRVKWLTNTTMSIIGVTILIGTFALFAFAGLAGMRSLITPGLITLGLGLGLWNVGTLGLMMDMSPASRAGTFLGFWTLVVTLSRGAGVSGGGIMLDLGRAITGDVTTAYVTVFVLAAAGLGVALWALLRVNVDRFHAEQPRDTAQIFAGAMD